MEPLLQPAAPGAPEALQGRTQVPKVGLTFHNGFCLYVIDRISARRIGNFTHEKRCLICMTRLCGLDVKLPLSFGRKLCLYRL